MLNINVQSVSYEHCLCDKKEDKIIGEIQVKVEGGKYWSHCMYGSNAMILGTRPMNACCVEYCVVCWQDMT